MDVEIENKKILLERQYITLLEQRVAELQKLVKPSKEEDNDSIAETNDEAAPNKGKPSSVTKTAPLTKENLAKVTNGTTETGRAIPKERVRHVVSKYNEKSGSREEIPIEKANLKDEGAGSECLLRNVMSTSDPKKISHNEIDLGQGPLLDLMRGILVEDDTDQKWTGPHVTFTTPFTLLVHKWDKLETETEIENSDDTVERKQARADLKKVLEFVQRSPGLETYFKNRVTNRNSGVVSFEYLWTVFAIGTEVITSSFLEEKQIMRVADPPFLFGDEKSQSMYCWYYDHDGTKWVVVWIEFEIDRYNGTKAIDTLQCYPLEYHKENGKGADLVELKSRFTKRGERFKELSTANPGVKQMFDYKGPLLSVEKPFRSQYSNDSTDEQNSYQSAVDRKPDSNTFKKTTVDGKILVDPKSFLEHGTYRTSSLKRITTLTKITAPVDWMLGEHSAIPMEGKEKRYDLSEEGKYLISPPRVLGWSTVRKSWCEFMVTEVQKTRSGNPTIFEEELQLDSKVKRMIKALVEQHNRKDAEHDVANPDLIEGKGRGLVIMLHGPPGVGKTLTAEAISEKTGRPLLIVSVAEIGLNASRAERNLERLFQLASRWQAILLVDEADVFLESRVSQADPNRNALVSVLLRVLEYYQGIMILTTNRINSLDVAVQSRIHLAVRFDDLDQGQMQSILKIMLKRFKVNESDITDILSNFKDYLDDNSGLRFNGRQIRNLVFSAHAMALSEKRSSCIYKDIKEVLRVTREFQNQLKDVIWNQRHSREAKTGITD